MSAEIAAIHGGHVPGEADVDIVADLERLLEAARSGEIVGFAYAYVMLEGGVSNGWCAVAGQRHRLSSAVMVLQHRYADALWSDA